MANCTKTQALSIAIKYLGEQYKGQLKVEELPSDIHIYNSGCYDAWFVAVPHIQQYPMYIGASRCILISKKTGKVVFDQMGGGS